MANITAADVNKLRQITGAGMMDCKQALVEADCDFEKAIDILRKKGQKVANKRSDREASEGIIIAKTNTAADFASIIMLNCETDFVAKNQEFIDFANAIADVSIGNKPQNIDELNALKVNNRTIADLVDEMMGKIGEKIGVGEYRFINAPSVYIYNHNGNKLASIVGLNKAGTAVAETGREIAMQIAAMSPVAIDKDDVDPSVIEREIEIGKEQARQEGKPEEMLEKIAAGKLNKFFKESTLLNQEYIKDSKKTVRQIMAECDKDLAVVKFERIALK